MKPAASLRAGVALGCLLAIAGARAQNPAPCEPKNWTTAEDHRNMLDQLGIKALRPGPSGNEKDANHANYDEALANPFPDLPEVLTLKDGRKVTTAAMWAERRNEIVEDFEREVIGRIPSNVPRVTWSVADSARGTLGSLPVVGKQLVGHVDNSSCPSINVDIQFTLVTPADVTAPVPVMIIFRGGTLGQALGTAPPPAGRGGFTPPPGMLGTDPPATEQLIAAGWGFAFLNPASIQADNGAGLTKGIIGLVNKGGPRKPDDWGSLRAWSWGAARALDYLETDPAVNARHVGIDGVSRYGKAALVTMAFERRFAVVLVGSSGEGGAKLHRRNFGEAVENLTGSGEYHWMAGNFLKYGAADAAFGSKTAADLPVDAHELIALCAPRPTFVSYGIPEKGDAKWLDQQGSYMATVAAGRVFRLLGAKDLGVGDDYKTAKLPGVNVSLLEGVLAWRQHDGGHTDGPNWKHFIPWADREFGRTRPVRVEAADRPMPRFDANSLVAHAQLVEKAKAGRIDVYFVGDSITRRWGALDYPDLLVNWKQNLFGWNAADFGWGADRTQNILWRLEHGELDEVNPKVIVVLAGTNNIGWKPPAGATLIGLPPVGADKIADVTRGVKAIVGACRRKAPGAVIVLTALFPRNDDMALVPEINAVNRNLAAMADGKTVRYLDVNDKLADKDGRLFDGMMHDKLHPTVKGYQVWADGLKPILAEILGPPAAIDLAPPPTGDPSAKK